MTVEEIEQELFEMEKTLKNMFNSCSRDLAIGIERLQGELAELKESKKEGKWKPKHNEEYWFVNSSGDVVCWVYENNTVSGWQVENLPVFPTKEACEKYYRFMDTVKEKSYEFSKEEWEDKVMPKWRIDYLFNVKKFKVDNTYSIYSTGTIYFKSKEDAQYIIDNFKEELMTYWL